MSVLDKVRKHGFRGSFRIALNVVCRPIRPVLYAFFRLFPINRRLIVFESEPDFCDNTWALYQYLKGGKKYRFIWVVAYPERYDNTSDTVFISRLGPGLRLKSYYYHARAAFLIFSHCTLPDHIRNKDQVLIYTSHGCAIKAGKGAGSLHFDYTLSLGKNVIGAQAAFCGCDREIVIPLGYPRNDILLQNRGTGGENPFSTGKNRKVILWMPTFRASPREAISEDSCDTQTGLPLFVDNESLDELNSFLQENDVEIILKIHHLQSRKPTYERSYSHLVFLTDEAIRKKGLQLYEIVGKSDALITDYSSISFDYYLVDKPIGFILDDMASYQSDRGFVWDDILQVMPGHHIFDKDAFFRFLQEVMSGEDRFASKREETMHFVFDNPDGRSSERFEDYFLNGHNRNDN